MANQGFGLKPFGLIWGDPSISVPSTLKSAPAIAQVFLTVRLMVQSVRTSPRITISSISVKA